MRTTPTPQPGDYDKLDKHRPSSHGGPSVVLQRLRAGIEGARKACVHGYARLRKGGPGGTRRNIRRVFKRRFGLVRTALVVVWVLLLWWGEVWLFDQAVEQCQWANWETWPKGSAPHHLAFVADPQLVDPHTYPGRPPLLSTLTQFHTDLYLRRSYSRIETDLDADTILFLGDLFDGGREWATGMSKSPDDQYHKYGQSFWQREFNRFSNIFFQEWGLVGPRDTQRKRRDGRRIIASLPGNHDLGFAGGISFPVKWRFQGWFGDGNRLDIIGNHTFVSLDTVSLSASEADKAPIGIHKPTDEFLVNLNKTRIDAIERHINHLFDISYPSRNQPRTVFDLGDPDTIIPMPAPPAPPALENKPKHLHPFPKMPTILLTHVPLYRPQGTPCGLLRERHPPQHDPPIYPDDGNSITISAGYQYQNTLSPTLTSKILSAFGSDLTHVFSGDDHDYCDILHEQPWLAGLSGTDLGAGRVREITVKSLSWAMGVRRPGFVLVSLYHPISKEGMALNPTKAASATVQTHLCLLPDQLAIFIRYACLVAITLFILFARSIAVVAAASETRDDIPYAIPRLDPSVRGAQKSYALSPSPVASAYSSVAGTHSRNRIGGSSPIHTPVDAGTMNGITNGNGSDYDRRRRRGDSDSKRKDDSDVEDDWATGTGTRSGGRRRVRDGCLGVLIEWVGGIWGVAWPVLVVYAVLLLW